MEEVHNKKGMFVALLHDIYITKTLRVTRSQRVGIFLTDFTGGFVRKVMTIESVDLCF